MVRSAGVSSVILALVLVACASSPPRPDPDVVARAEASKLLAAGDYRAAASILDPLVRKNPRDAEAQSMLGEALWRLGKPDEAVSHLEESLRADYSDYRSHMLLGQILAEKGKMGRALTEFALSVEFGPNEPLALYNYGLALYRMGKREDAIVQWSKAFEIDPENPRYAAALGMGYAGLDDEKALYYFENAKALGEDSPSFHNNFGLLLGRLGEFGKAKSHLEAAVRAEPKESSYRFNLASLYMKSGEPERALPHWGALVERNPKDRAARIYLARALLDLKRYGEAVSTLEREVREWSARIADEPGRSSRDPSSGAGRPGLDDALAVLAMAYRGEGNLSKAREYIEKALALAPQDPGHLLDYGVIEAESGNIEKALRTWRRVLELDPGNEAARSNLKKYSR